VLKKDHGPTPTNLENFVNDPLVKNASNEKQIKNAQSKERMVRSRELDDLRAVLGTLAGRRLFWRLLSHCHVFESVWRPSAEIHHLAGKQDVGHFLMGEVVEADEEFLFQMMRENKKENS
jgi:hypothetical protein